MICVEQAEMESVALDLDLEDKLVPVTATVMDSIEAIKKQIFDLDTNEVLDDDDSVK